jgi:hypothetical protein
VEPGDEVERNQGCFKVIWRLGVSYGMVLSAWIWFLFMRAIRGYDLFLLMSIFPVNENSALSAVELL